MTLPLVLAPIVLFVYNRPWHTQQTIEALRKNLLATESELFIYSDAPKNEQAKEKVQQVRSYIKNISGFRTITIIEKDSNWGLANSIIDGVTTIVNRYGKVIVLEDDLVTSPYFLSFMNQALNFYADEKKVWHISGWNYPIEAEELEDAYFWRVMNCWGWATWADRWRNFEKNPQRLINSWSQQQQHHFDLDGSGEFWPQVIANAKGAINTWAIFWYSTLYEKQGLCLNSAQSYVENIGHDGSGVHCGNSKTSDRFKKVLCTKNQPKLPKIIEESEIAIKELKKLLSQNFFQKTWKKICKLTFGA